MTHLEKRIRAGARRFKLSPRETEIVEGLASNENRKSIAFFLKISRQTVDFHIMHILTKTRTVNITAAVVRIATQ